MSAVATALVIATNVAIGAGVTHLGASSANAADPLGEILLESNFDDGNLDGWSRGSSGLKGTDENWGTVHTIDWPGGHVQVIQLDGLGGRNHPNSWIFRQIDVPAAAKTLTFDTAGHDRAGSDAELRVRVVGNGASVTLLDEIEHGCAGCKGFHGRSIDISAWAGKTVTFFFEQNDNGSHGVFPGVNEQILLDNIRIRGALPPCDLAGVVRDGELAGDGHANPLAGVPVTLLQDGNPVVGPVVTDVVGHYCIPGGLVDPGDYQLQVGLVDAKDNPSIFKTVHGASDDAVTTTVDVTGEDFGREDFDVSFAATAAQPWQADVADIHWESARFVDWLVGTLGFAPSRLVGLTIETGSSTNTSYKASLRRVYIAAANTPFAAREDAASLCPENCEWHEITHHLENVLGIARTSAPACSGRVVHGGWSNATTCDSLGEGLPMFLPTFASLDLDAGRTGGYATDAYSVFGSLEANNFRPWSQTASGYFDEDTAVGQLLWDLADDTPDEQEAALYRDQPAGSPEHAYTSHDRVALGGVELIHLLGSEKPTTVADMYDDLVADPSVPARLKSPDFDLDGDGTPDLSPLAEVFVLHGFHPAGPIRFDVYRLGSPIGVTPPGAQNLSDRRDKPVPPGSAVRLQNPAGTAVTVGIDIAYATETTHFDVVVPADGERLVQIQLPPYWGGPLPSGGSLPACSAADPTQVTLTLSAAGVAPKTMTNCDYLHAIAATTADAVMTLNVGAAPVASARPAATALASPTAASPGGSAVPMLLLVAMLLAIAVAGLVVLRRRRRAPKR